MARNVEIRESRPSSLTLLSAQWKTRIYCGSESTLPPADSSSVYPPAAPGDGVFERRHQTATSPVDGSKPSAAQLVLYPGEALQPCARPCRQRPILGDPELVLERPCSCLASTGTRPAIDAEAKKKREDGEERWNLTNNDACEHQLLLLISALDTRLLIKSSCSCSASLWILVAPWPFEDDPRQEKLNCDAVAMVATTRFMSKNSTPCTLPNVGLSANQTFAVSQASKLSAKEQPSATTMFAFELSTNANFAESLSKDTLGKFGPLGIRDHVPQTTCGAANGPYMVLTAKGALPRAADVLSAKLDTWHGIRQPLCREFCLSSRQRQGLPRAFQSLTAKACFAESFLAALGKRGVCRELCLVALGKDLFAESLQRGSRQTASRLTANTAFAESLDLAHGKGYAHGKPPKYNRSPSPSALHFPPGAASLRSHCSHRRPPLLHPRTTALRSSTPAASPRVIAAYAKRVVLTAAGDAISRGIASNLAKHGCRLVLVGDEGALAATADDARCCGGLGVEVVGLDLEACDEATVDAAVDRAWRCFHGLDAFPILDSTLTIIDASRIARREEVVRQHVMEFDDEAGVGDMLNDYDEAHFNEGLSEEEPEEDADDGQKKQSKLPTPRDSAKGAERKRHNPPTHDTGAAADIVSTERTERESLQANLTQMYAWMQSVGTQVSVPPPQLQFQPPPRQSTPGLSAGSNDPAGIVNMSPGVSPAPRVSDWSPWGTQQDGQGSQDRDLSNPSQAHNPTGPDSRQRAIFCREQGVRLSAKCHFLPPVQRPHACPPHGLFAEILARSSRQKIAPLPRASHVAHGKKWHLCREPRTWLSANLEFFAESLARGSRQTQLRAPQRRRNAVSPVLGPGFAERLHALGKYLRCTRQRLCRDPDRKLSAKGASPRKTLPSKLCREPALGKGFAERMVLFAESARLTAKSLDPVVMGPELLVFRSGDGVEAISHCDDDDVEQLASSWETDIVLPVGDELLCWVDLSQGLLFFDVSGRSLGLRLVRLPVPMDYSRRARTSYRNVCVTAGDVIKFVEVSPRCPRSHHAYSPTLMDEDDMVWEMDGVLDAAELWALDGYKGLPHTMDDPHAICFMVCKMLHHEYEESSSEPTKADSQEAKILAALQEIPGLDRGHILKAYRILSHDDSGRREQPHHRRPPHQRWTTTERMDSNMVWEMDCVVDTTQPCGLSTASSTAIRRCIRRIWLTANLPLCREPDLAAQGKAAQMPFSTSPFTFPFTSLKNFTHRTPHTAHLLSRSHRRRQPSPPPPAASPDVRAGRQAARGQPLPASRASPAPGRPARRAAAGQPAPAAAGQASCASQARAAVPARLPAAQARAGQAAPGQARPTLAPSRALELAPPWEASLAPATVMTTRATANFSTTSSLHTQCGYKAHHFVAGLD
ncbi:hypothetical protein HU200_016837 [Digitaria exilis]|uniref:DUF1618 domain-containing protein n=1 Tax=Digitaria exilis TaxID=1010633 RepID=A0A835KKS3_9POAL|nr:hypothetical protein HU200_016837 [Digitaria exilis]